MYLIYKADKIEKEPTGLLVKIFIFGALSTIGAMILESIGTIILAYLGMSENSLIYIVLMNFIVVGVSEEFVKRCAMKWPTWKNPEFNYHFDGVVYGVAATLGFAALENFLYVASIGIYLAPIRAVLSIPLHCICGVYMGYFYGKAKYYDLKGMVAERKRNMRLSILIPALIHGFYDFGASIDSDLVTIIWFVFVIVMDIMAIRYVKQFSREDAPITEDN